MEQRIHKFESAGLGIAPFHCVNMYAKTYGDHGQPAGTCDYCSNGIKYCYVIRSADGREFVVGSECVRKTEDAALTRSVRAAKHTARNPALTARNAERQAKVAAQQQAHAALVAGRIATLAPITSNLVADLLATGNSFATEIATCIRDRGELPTEGGEAIALDILAKTHGRRNSKAYEARHRSAAAAFQAARDAVNP